MYLSRLSHSEAPTCITSRLRIDTSVHWPTGRRWAQRRSNVGDDSSRDDRARLYDRQHCSPRVRYVRQLITAARTTDGRKIRVESVHPSYSQRRLTRAEYRSNDLQLDGRPSRKRDTVAGAASRRVCSVTLGSRPSTSYWCMEDNRLCETDMYVHWEGVPTVAGRVRVWESYHACLNVREAGLDRIQLIDTEE